MQGQEQSFNPLDKIFRQKLSNLESGYSPTVWEQIQEELAPSKQPRRPVALFWFLGLMITALLFWILWTQLDTVNSKSYATKHLSNTITSSSISNEEKPESSKAILAIIENKEESIPAENESTQKSLDLVSTSAALINNKELEVDHSVTDAKTKTSVEKLISQNAKTAVRKYNYSTLAPLSLKNTLLECSLDYGKLFTRKIDPSDCPDFSRKSKGEISFDLYYSSDLPLRKLKAINSEFESYAIARNETESELYSFSIGARASYHVSPSLAIRSGLHYSQINERFNYEDPDAQQVQTIITIDSSFINGMWEITRDTQTIRLTGVNEIQHYNRFKMLDIPFLVGYEMAGEKYDLAINGGVMLNILFSQKGRFLNPALSPTDFDSGDPNQFNAFKSNVGISIYGSFSLAYKLDSKWSLLFEPNFRHYINHVTLNSYPLKQSYTTVGFLTGVRYHF